ncbi:MAG TPA: arylesterase [Gammaproteobacteria bacterium]|nr:arylesterase [Gammaproteobacteria bacterium]
MLKRPALHYFLFVFALILPAAINAGNATILVFGDSLSAAYGIEQNAGWVNLLQRRLQQTAPRYQVINASISGDTTSGGLARLSRALDKHQPAIVIVELGANDGLRGLSLEETQKNLAAIIEQTLSRKARVLLVGIRLPPNYGPDYTRKFHEIYSSLAKRYRVPLTSFLLEGVAGNPDLMQQDGLHPRASAQPIVLENVWRVLQPML